jgi:hypothetical protein
MTRDDAYQLVCGWTKNPNLVKHMLAVEAIMAALAIHFHEDEQLYRIAGLVHDADYEQFKDGDPKRHPSVIFDELAKRGADPKVIAAVRSHAWGWREDLPKPETKMEWSLYCADELSGLITACALVRPDKKLESLTIESVMKKFPQKAFAAGAIRENILHCEKELGIPLPEFVGIALGAMQGIHEELGL